MYTELKVMQSAAGYYIGRGYVVEEEWGTYEEPGSRESGYYKTREAAQCALETEFDVRDCVENNSAYDNGSLPDIR